MRIYSSAQIDKLKWDNLLASCNEPCIYVASWFLDAAYPGWKAMIWEKHEQYIAAIPLPTKELLVFRWIQIPFYVQKTGLLYCKDGSPKEYLSDFFNANFYKKYLGINIAFQTSLTEELVSLYPANWECKNRINYVLNLASSYATLFGQYNENRKRNLKKAFKAGWECEPSDNITAALEMYESFQMVKQNDANKRALGTIKEIYNRAKMEGLAELYQVRNSSGQVLAFTLFLRFDKRLYFIFSSMNEEGKSNSASSLPFDYVIKKYASQSLTLDFEGGNIEGIGRYFASFGAVTEEYLTLSYKKFNF